MAGSCRVCGNSWPRMVASEVINAGPVCEHCSGSRDDITEALSRASEQLAQLTTLSIANAVKIAKGAQLRRRVRLGLIPRPANRKKPAT